MSKRNVLRGETQKFITPAAPCRWARLKDPRSPFEGGDPDYWQISVEVTPEVDAWLAEQVQPYLDSEQAKLEALAGKKAQTAFPIVKEEKDGTRCIRFSKNAWWIDKSTDPPTREDKQAPLVFNAQNTAFDTDQIIGNGSIVRVAFAMTPKLHKFGFSAAVYLNSVQVISLEEYSPPSPFDAVEVAAEPVDESPFVADDYVNKGQETIPF